MDTQFFDDKPFYDRSQSERERSMAYAQYERDYWPGKKVKILVGWQTGMIGRVFDVYEYDWRNMRAIVRVIIPGTGSQLYSSNEFMEVHHEQ